MKAIVVRSFGGAENLHLEDIPHSELGIHEVRVRIECCGVNFIDVYHRTGLYKQPLPYLPGLEGAGIISEVGREVVDWRVGERVAFCQVQGAYAESIVTVGKNLIKIPQNVTSQLAAAVMLQGLTAHYLANSIVPIGPKVSVLIQAGAGGVGLLLTQLIKAKGATVYTLVSSKEKADLSKKNGGRPGTNWDRIGV